MATTHRPNDRGFAPDFEFKLAIGVLSASEALAARRRPVNPDTLARQLRAQPSGAHPTVTQIQEALAQVQRWRERIITRDLLQHRQQLVALSAELEGQRRRLDEDRVYLTRMLRQIDALLRNSLTVPDGAETAARPGARRALQ
jgi:peptidoglycan hydrolase-like protein with peptidoglycan-binding domain